MNESGPKQDPGKRRGYGRWVVFALVAGVLLFFLVTASPHSWPWYRVPRHDAQKRTEVILMTVRVGIILEIANKGSAPPSFDGLCAAFKNSSAYAELTSLKAIDHERRCFVDGWGRPIEIVANATGGMTVTSSGRDGMAGTKDDLRGDASYP